MATRFIETTGIWMCVLLTLTALFIGFSGARAKAASPAQPVPPIVQLHTESGPWIEIDGVKHPPLMLFVNSELKMSEVMHDVKDQLLFAKEAGIPFVSIPAQFPWEVGGMRDFSHLQLWFDFVLGLYPEAYIIPRVRLDPPMDYWGSRHPDELIRYADGSTSLFSLGSDVWRERVKDSLKAGIEFVESHARYASQVVGYHLAYGGTNEWFHFWYREKGNDVSRLNADTFTEWLVDRYGSEAGIGAAWSKDNFQLSDVTILPDPRSYSSQPFLDPAYHQEMMDFFDYTNAIVADRLIEMAEYVKVLTKGDRLVVAFYGYTFELRKAHSGHLNLGRVLESDAIDILASPFSYHMRDVGELGAFMAPIDSTLRNGKLWVMEDDTRTFLASHTDRDGGYNVYLKTLEDSIAVHRRNLGSLIVHGGGVWWMDLWSGGWLNHPELWANVEAMKDVYVKYRKEAEPFRPDVAFVVDEASVKLTTQGQATNQLLLFRQREPIYRSGVSYGLYLLDDVLKDGLEGTKVYFFLNVLRLTDEQRASIGRLKADGNTLVWVYGADVIGDLDGDDARTPGEIIGFDLQPVTERVGGKLKPTAHTGVETPLPGMFGENLRGAPVYQVTEAPGVESLATYVGADSAVGFARRTYDDWTSVFYGSWMLDPAVIREIVAGASAPVYLNTNDVLHTDGRFFSVHANASGTKTLQFGAVGDVVDPWTDELLATDVSEYRFTMEKGETTWLEFRSSNVSP